MDRELLRVTANEDKPQVMFQCSCKSETARNVMQMQHISEAQEAGLRLAGVTAVKCKLQVQIVSVQQSLAGSPRLDQQADTSLCQLDAAYCGRRGGSCSSWA